MNKKVFWENIGWIGGAIAAGLSFAKWGSFWYAIGHFCLVWIYVVYYIAKYVIH